MKSYWKDGQRASPFLLLCAMIIAAFQYLRGEYRDAGEGLFIRDCSDRTRDDGFKLKQGRLRLDIRRKFSTVRVARYWHRLPQEALTAPRLAMFKARLDRAWSKLL